MGLAVQQDPFFISVIAKIDFGFLSRSKYVLWGERGTPGYGKSKTTKNK